MHSAFESKAFPNWPGETKGTTSYLYSMSKTAPGTVQGTLDLRKDLQGHIKRSKHVIMAYWQSRSVPRKKLMATCALRFSPLHLNRQWKMGMSPRQGCFVYNLRAYSTKP